MSIELFNMDCMELMRQTPDKAFDIAIVDPPYGIDINMNMGRRRGAAKVHEDKEWDGSIPPPQYFDELRRVSQNQIIWGGNYFPLPQTKSWILWDKDVPMGVSFADGELAWTSFDKVLRIARIPYSGFRGSEGKIHPTQKPVALYRWLLKNYAKPGQRILDTHGGSMSIAIACDIEGFDLTICEIDKDYFEAGKKRLADHQAQPRLFDTPKPSPGEQKTLETH